MSHTGIGRLARFVLSVFVAAQLSACGTPSSKRENAGGGSPDTTFGKFLARAEAGDAESQNVVGFMLFHGEGVRMDRTRAKEWFQRAAALGNARAQRNIAVLYSAGVTEPGLASDQMPPAVQLPGSSPGQTQYAKYCGGCHGFNGFATYVHAPSFALGEALEKSDAQLTISLMRGSGEMPDWDNKLSPADLQAVLRFVRTLQARYELGVGQTLSGAPPVFYLFGPADPEHSAYRGLPAYHGVKLPKTDK